MEGHRLAGSRKVSGQKGDERSEERYISERMKNPNGQALGPRVLAMLGRRGIKTPRGVRKAGYDEARIQR
jgi:hypothetical protein